MSLSELIDKYQHWILFIITLAMILTGIIFTLGQSKLQNHLGVMDYIFIIIVLSCGLVWWLYTFMSLFTYIFNGEILYTISILLILIILLIILVGIFQYLNYITIHINGHAKGSGYLTGIYITILILTFIIFGLIYVYQFK